MLWHSNSNLSDVHSLWQSYNLPVQKNKIDMKVIVIVLVFILVWRGIIWIFSKMMDWSDSSNEIKSNIGCWTLTIISVAVMIIMTIGSLKSCIDSSNRSPSYDYYDDRTPR